MKKIMTFGEILMRISPLGNKKLVQSNQLEYYFGGTEVNVAISLAQLGNDVKHVAAVPEDFVGEAAKSFLNQYGVDTSMLMTSTYPLGLYFLEVGAIMRSSTISYNRSHSAFAMMNSEIIDWDLAFDDCDWFHWTGITPALSKGASQGLKKALQIAKDKNISISADPAYRANLWQYGGNSKEILGELVGLSDTFIGGPNEINELLNTNFENDVNGFVVSCKHLISAFPSINRVFDKTRVSVNANWHKIKSRMWDGKELYETEELEMTHIVDRIGTGDAFAAGLIHGLLHYKDQKALQFANAACALKHTIEGDANLVTENEIELVVNGGLTGRIKR
ncbi:sugar kinase [Aquimarina algiphila]|uniref:Sugar kinase n=1 Tax=Aquimarina algiphila TaxID=2047982 RepID=A0A554VN91_9FLAO|nr:sugar kinase [Aquimarina algiphila]TSE09831.1 sugar kinase [Aquimarina algiphila]